MGGRGSLLISGGFIIKMEMLSRIMLNIFIQEIIYTKNIKNYLKE